MSAETQPSRSEPRFHAANIRKMLTELIDHTLKDATRVSDPKAQALFETTAEVLIVLRRAYEEYERRNEPVWKQAG